MRWPYCRVFWLCRPTSPSGSTHHTILPFRRDFFQNLEYRRKTVHLHVLWRCRQGNKNPKRLHGDVIRDFMLSGSESSLANCFVNTFVLMNNECIKNAKMVKNPWSTPSHLFQPDSSLINWLLNHNHKLSIHVHWKFYRATNNKKIEEHKILTRILGDDRINRSTTASNYSIKYDTVYAPQRIMIGKL